MNKEELKLIEQKFRESAENMTYDANNKINDANPHHKLSLDLSREERFRKLEDDNANMYYANAAEMALKSHIIYDDMSKDARFNSLTTKTIVYPKDDRGNTERGNVPAVGSHYWNESLKGEMKSIGGFLSPNLLNVIGKPESIKKMILYNTPYDERKNIIADNDNNHNADFKTLTFDGTKVNGHSLYSYFQLLSSKPKNYSTFEYWADVPGKDKYTLYAYLFGEKDMIKISNGKSIMTPDFLTSINEVKKFFVEARYEPISTDYTMAPKKSSFIKHFSSVLVDVGNYRFPTNIDKNQYSYEDFFAKGFKEFDALDDLSKYYLQSCFNKDEIDELVTFINRCKKVNPYNINEFINETIFIKKYCLNNDIPGDFTLKQYIRIYNLYEGLKAFQLFDPNSKLLKDYDEFNSEEKISVYIDQMNLAREKEKSKIDSEPIVDESANSMHKFKSTKNTNLIEEYNELKNMTDLTEKQSNLDDILSKIYSNYSQATKDIARKYSKLDKLVSVDDLVQEGNLGLFEAVKTYDINSDKSFDDYAKEQIEKHIMNYIKVEENSEKLPVHVFDDIIKLKKIRGEYILKYGEEPPYDYLAKELGLSIHDVMKLSEKDYGGVSLDQYVGTLYPDGYEDRLESFIGDPNINKENENNVLNVIFNSNLSEKEIKVLTMRFGLNNSQQMTLDEISKEFGLTRERIRQIEAKALRKLRRTELYKNVNTNQISM